MSTFDVLSNAFKKGIFQFQAIIKNELSHPESESNFDKDIQKLVYHIIFTNELKAVCVVLIPPMIMFRFITDYL